MKVMLKKGELTKYRKEYAEIHPTTYIYNLPLYIIRSFENHVAEVGEIEIQEAYKWIVENHISKKEYGTRHSYKRLFCKLFDYICAKHNTTFHDNAGAEIIIQYNLEKGIIAFECPTKKEYT